MKKLVWLLLAAMLLAACGVPADAPRVTPTRFAGAPSDRIEEVAGLTVDDVRAIWRFDDSMPPDIPARIVYREKDLRALLEALQAVRLTGAVEMATAAPGDYWSYRVYPFEGESFEIHFNSQRVLTQGQSFGYRDSAAVQQVIDEMESDPYLPGGDAFEAVEQLKISDSAGERTVTDKEQIGDYLRMFTHMTFTGRSREMLAGGTTYAFRYKDGKELVLRLDGGLLATAEGTYEVKFDPDYAVVAEPTGQ